MPHARQVKLGAIIIKTVKGARNGDQRGAAFVEFHAALQKTVERSHQFVRQFSPLGVTGNTSRFGCHKI